ncbi:5 bisphosphate carboxylase/oxygenase large subunit N-methyltransferase, partial [Durusdinium trenchii]
WLGEEHADLADAVVRFAQRQPGASLQGRALLAGSVSFILFLLRQLAGPSDDARAHFDAMPKSVHVPLFWDDQALAELQASDLVRHISERRQLVHAVFSEVVQPSSLGDEISASNFAFAWSLLLSRATSDLKNNMPFAIVPFLDMFNHSVHDSVPGFCQHWFDHAKQEFVVAPVRNVQGDDEQLFISYGQLGNAELLRLYGFVDPNNPSDSVKVQVTPNTTATCFRTGDLEVNGSDAEPADVQRAVRAKLDLYGTTIEEDRTQLEALLSGASDSSSSKLFQAMCVRLGEKESRRNDYSADGRDRNDGLQRALERMPSTTSTEARLAGIDMTRQSQAVERNPSESGVELLLSSKVRSMLCFRGRRRILCCLGNASLDRSDV